MFSRYLIPQKERILLVLAAAAVPSLLLHLFFSLIILATAVSIYQSVYPPPPPEPSHFTIAACHFPAPVQILFKWTTLFALIVTTVCIYIRRIFLSFLTLLAPFAIALHWFNFTVQSRLWNINEFGMYFEETPIHRTLFFSADFVDMFFLAVILFLLFWHTKIILQDFIKYIRIVGKLP